MSLQIDLPRIEFNDFFGQDREPKALLDTIVRPEFNDAMQKIEEHINHVGYMPVTPVAGVLTIDLSESHFFYTGALSANITSITIINPTDSMMWTILFLQDGTGGKTVSGWPADVLFAGGSYAIDSTANQFSNITFAYMGGTHFEVSRALESLNTSTIVSSILNQKIFNVRDYGAVGNGTTDDYTAIALANAAIPTAGGVLYFPAGTYLSTGTIVQKPNTTIMGQGFGSVIKAGTNSVVLISSTTPTTLVYNYGLDNICLDAGSTTGGTAYYLNGVDQTKRISNILIRDVLVKGTFTNGIYLAHTANAFLSNVYTRQPTNGFMQNICADTHYSQCSAQLGTGSGFSILGDGVTSHGDEGTRLTNCSTNGQAIGAHIDGVDWVTLTGCSFSTCSSGAVIIEGSTDVRLVGCEIASAATATGVNCDSAAHSIQVVGCFIAGNDYGIVFRGQRNLAQGNILAANSACDIYLDSTALRSTIVGNSCESSPDPSINETTGANFTLVVGNNCMNAISITGANSSKTAVNLE